MSERNWDRLSLAAAVGFAGAAICFTIAGAASTIVGSIDEQTYRQAVDTNIIEGALQGIERDAQEKRCGK